MSDEQIAREILDKHFAGDPLWAHKPLFESIVAALAAARQPEQGAQPTPPEGELISREAAIERAAVSIAEYVQAPASFIGTIEQIIRRELAALPAAPTGCLMADCTEPQAHFCVTHVLEVHAAPTDEQQVPKILDDDEEITYQEYAERLLKRFTALKLEADELREALEECVDEIESILITAGWTMTRATRAKVERARKLIETN